MKRTTLKLTLALLLSVCTLAGCGDSSSSKKSEKKSKPETTTVAEEKTEEQKTTVKDNGGSNASNVAEGTDFKRGVVENNVYTNEFAGFKLSVPDEWKFLDDDTIQKMMNMGADATYSSNADAVKDIVNQTTINDAVCMNSKTNQSVTITFENLNKSIVLSTDTTAEDYFKIADRQFAVVPNVKYTKEEGPETVTLGGKEYIRAIYSVEYSGVSYKQSYYIARVCDFMNVVAVTSYDPDEDIAAFESYFSAID